METRKPGNQPILSQTENNTTLWVGHLQADPNDHFAGQTFTCPEDGLVNNIQVYSAAVQQAGDITLTLHEFNSDTKTWGPSIGNASLHLDKEDEDKWVRFELPPVSLRKNTDYGFRLQTNNAMVGIGEAASHAKHPFTFGNEWKGDSKNEKGEYFTYFSLTFKIEMCA